LRTKQLRAILGQQCVGVMNDCVLVIGLNAHKCVQSQHHQQTCGH
jgi:hypothetical protein